MWKAFFGVLMVWGTCIFGGQQTIEEFLAQNGQKEGIVSLKDGLVQWEVLEEGEGKIVTEEDIPLIWYSLSLLDGRHVQEGEFRCAFDKVVSGFKMGVVGMKEGEKRRLWIHPQLAYGMESGTPLSQVLLIFDVEVKQIKN